MPGLRETRHHLHPAEDLLDPFAMNLARLIPLAHHHLFADIRAPTRITRRCRRPRDTLTSGSTRSRLLPFGYPREETALWDDLQDLFDLIDRGHRRYGVYTYNSGLFDLEADSFLAAKKLPDWYLARVLDQLGRAPQPSGTDLGLFRATITTSRSSNLAASTRAS